jgi:hypothetical protein
MSTPMRRIRSSCCARAASGHTTAALPMSVMKSRRLMGAYPKAKITTDYSSFGVGRWRASQQKKRRMTAWGHTRSIGDVGPVSGLPESGHGPAIYEYTP